MAQFSLFLTPIGTCGIAWRDDQVIATQLPETTTNATASRLASRTGASRGEPPPVIEHAIVLMTNLLEGLKTDLGGINCDFSNVDTFETQVYAVTRAIPAGNTLTYGAIAEQLGDKLLARDVGRALGRNPIPIIVPCHRVLGANGKLTGFSAHGGVETKLKMLAIEGARTSDEPDLFDSLPPPKNSPTN